MGEKMDRLTVVVWKWRPYEGYRSHFTAEHVNVMRNMVRRNLSVDHEFVCVTDDPAGIDADIRVVPLWEDFSHLQNPHGPKRGPSCYRRLKAFSAEAADILGPRILSIDLDAVILRDITPLVDRDEDFVIWGDTSPGTPYNGGLWLLRAGTRTKVWTDFDPDKSPAIGRARGYIGSDQAWIAVALGPDEKKWTRGDGVFSFRNEVQRFGLSKRARIVMFHGEHDPWNAGIQARYSWVREHWR